MILITQHQRPRKIFLTVKPFTIQPQMTHCISPQPIPSTSATVFNERTDNIVGIIVARRGRRICHNLIHTKEQNELAEVTAVYHQSIRKLQFYLFRKINCFIVISS